MRRPPRAPPQPAQEHPLPSAARGHAARRRSPPRYCAALALTASRDPRATRPASAAASPSGMPTMSHRHARCVARLCRVRMSTGDRRRHEARRDHRSRRGRRGPGPPPTERPANSRSRDTPSRRGRPRSTRPPGRNTKMRRRTRKLRWPSAATRGRSGGPSLRVISPLRQRARRPRPGAKAMRHAKGIGKGLARGGTPPRLSRRMRTVAC